MPTQREIDTAVIGLGAELNGMVNAKTAQRALADAKQQLADQRQMFYERLRVERDYLRDQKRYAEADQWTFAMNLIKNFRSPGGRTDEASTFGDRHEVQDADRKQRLNRLTKEN